MKHYLGTAPSQRTPDHKTLSINLTAHQEENTVIEFMFSDTTAPDSEVSLVINGDGTWIFGYKKPEKKMYSTGITLNQKLYIKIK